MREIKFRVYCYADDNKQMVYLTNGEFDNGYWFSCPAGIVHIDEYLSPLMQFTGLKDKNGKQIYEGDIFYSRFLGINVAVEWEEKYGQFTANGLEFNVELNLNKIEIIGNIYENPELLSSEQEDERSVARDDDS